MYWSIEYFNLVNEKKVNLYSSNKLQDIKKSIKKIVSTYAADSRFRIEKFGKNEYYLYNGNNLMGIIEIVNKAYTIL